MPTTCTAPVQTFSCPECRLHFAEKSILEDHQRKNLHAHCYNCDFASSTRQLHAIHMQSHSPTPAITLLSVTQFRCCDCKRDFKDDVALANHLRSSKVHKPRAGTEGNKNRRKQKQQDKSRKQDEKGRLGAKCKECKKTFQTQDALRRHLKSVRHNPLSNIECLADMKCKKRFNCPSGQIQHLESGKCVSGMTRAKLNAAVAVNDIRGIITTGGDAVVQWSLEDTPSVTSTSSSQTASPILTPTSTDFLDSYPPSAIGTPTSTLTASTNLPSMVTLWSRIGTDPQACPLCPPSSTRKFKPGSLRQHLSSKVHAQVSAHLPSPMSNKISFHCPRSLMDGESKKAVKQFSSVSGLAQHLESGACAGDKGTLRRVIEYVQEEMKNIGLGELKLLK